MKAEKHLATLTAVFCVFLVVSNVIAGKLWAVTGSITLTAGVILFPVVYIIGDVVPEVYGLKAARRMILIGFLINLAVVGFFLITLALPYPPFWQNQSAFETVFSFTPRLLLASAVGYLVGTNANAWVMVAMKKATGGRWLWSRTITSTLVGESLDSFFFMTIAFWGIVPIAVLPGMMLAQVTFKVLYEVIATPITYGVVAWIKKSEATEDPSPVTA